MEHVILRMCRPLRSPRSSVLRGVLSLLLLAGSLTYAAAQGTVTGKVLDETGTGLPGVNILVKSTTNGTTSDGNGNYSIEVPGEDAVLVFSFIGYETQEVAVGTRTTIDVNLVPSIESLSEIVVVGYGVQKKSDVTGSLVSVKSDALKEVPVANIQQALQGRAAGVEVQQVGTAPGATAQIRIRGERSVSGDNAPLIVLDGIPFSGSLSDINQNEIETVNILKDASATAIYGSRGANGVIIITTRRGKSGENRLSFDSYFGISTVARKYDMYNAEEYANMRDASAWPYGYMPEEVEGQALGRNTDWQDLMYEDGYITDNNIGVTGGTEKAQFALGAGYFKQTTVLPGQDFTRYSMKAAIDTRIGPKLQIGLNSLNSLSLTNGAQFLNQQPNTPGAYGGSMMYPILATSPLMPAYDENGEIVQRPFGNVDDQAGSYSPLYLKQNLNDFSDKIRRIRTFNNAYAEYEFIEGLKYRLNIGLEYGQTNSAQFRGKDSYFRPNNQVSQARVRNAEDYSWTVENILTYDRTFAEKHKFTFTGLYSAQQASGYFTQVTQEDVTADFIEYYNPELANPSAQRVVTGGEQTWGILSVMGRINYSFSDRFLVTATYRSDGSSRLVNKWVSYPAAAVGWNIIRESFMDELQAVSNLKLRVGYGQTSNQSVAPYTSLGGVSGNYQGVPIRYNYGAQQVIGFLPTRVPDKSIDWEYTNVFNVGLDFGFLDERITGTIDWYNAQTSNLLFPRTIPITSGYPDAFETNVGSMENKGLEIALYADVISSPSGFKWSVDLNYFYNRNKLLSISSGVDRIINNGLFVGYPTNAIFDYKKLGIWQLGEEAEAAAFGQAPGQIKLADLSGPDGEPDGVINELDRTVIGDQQPKWQGGMTNRLSYKGFEFTMVAYARMGGTLMSYLHAPNGAYLTNLSGQRNGLDVDYWTPTNPTNWFPAPSAPLPGGASGAWSTLAYYDASFIRIRSMTVGYNLPTSVLEKIKAHSIRVYFTAQNPFLFASPYVSKYNGVDPEPTGAGGTGAVATSGTFRTGGANPALIISASTPPTRSFIFGVNLKF